MRQKRGLAKANNAFPLKGGQLVEQPERIFCKKKNKRIGRGNCFFLVPSCCNFFGTCEIKQLAEKKKQTFLNIQRGIQGLPQQ